MKLQCRMQLKLAGPTSDELNRHAFVLAANKRYLPVAKKPTDTIRYEQNHRYRKQNLVYQEKCYYLGATNRKHSGV